jgi:hypothetical protein
MGKISECTSYPFFEAARAGSVYDRYRFWETECFDAYHHSILIYRFPSGNSSSYIPQARLLPAFLTSTACQIRVPLFINSQLHKRDLFQIEMLYR